MTYLQSLDKALDLFMEFKFSESDFYFLNGSKNCLVATYNFVSVYILVLFSLPLSLFQEMMQTLKASKGDNVNPFQLYRPEKKI